MPTTTFIFLTTNLRSKNVKFNVFFLTDGRKKRKKKIKVEGKRWLVKKEKKRIKRWFCYDGTTLYGKIFSNTLLLIPYCVSHVHLSTSFCRNLNLKSLSYLWVIGTWINGSNINFWIRLHLSRDLFFHIFLGKEEIVSSHSGRCLHLLFEVYAMFGWSDFWNKLM